MPSGECLRGEGLVWLIGAVVCVVAVAFALPHHWLLPINCHFLRLYSAAGRGIAALNSTIEESDLYHYRFYVTAGLLTRDVLSFLISWYFSDTGIHTGIRKISWY